jgi:NADH dehydrogenase FAD-containing subunit
MGMSQTSVRANVRHPHKCMTKQIEEEMIDQETHHTPAVRSGRFEVLIAGGGVAGLEAAFALQHLAGDRVHVCVVSVGTDFVYRPLVSPAAN